MRTDEEKRRMLYTSKFKMKTKPKNISTTARIAMPVKDLSTGKYLKFGYINLLSFGKRVESPQQERLCR